MTTQTLIDTLRLKITLAVGVLAPPNLFSNYITVDDISDWASILSGAQTIKTLYHIQTQVNTTVYKSAGYDTDDYTTPEYPTNDPLAQKQLPLAASGDPVEGVYKINVKVKFDDGVTPVYALIVISSQALCIADKPTGSLSSEYSCSAATFTSTDGTNYGNSKYTQVALVRAHTVYPPDISGQSAVTVDSPTNSVGSLWTDVEYEQKLAATVTYKKVVDGIETYFIFYITATARKEINCDDALCTLYCLLKKIRDEYYLYAGKNPTKERELFNKLFLGWHEYFMAIQARICNPANEAGHVSKFYEVTQLDPNCDCGCGSTTNGTGGAPVIPTSPGGGNDGDDGTDGLTPELRMNANILQWKYTSESASLWRNLADLSALVGDDGEDGSVLRGYTFNPTTSSLAFFTLASIKVDVMAVSDAFKVALQAMYKHVGGTSGGYVQVRVSDGTVSNTLITVGLDDPSIGIINGRDGVTIDILAIRSGLGILFRSSSAFALVNNYSAGILSSVQSGVIHLAYNQVVNVMDYTQKLTIIIEARVLDVQNEIKVVNAIVEQENFEVVI